MRKVKYLLLFCALFFYGCSQVLTISDGVFTAKAKKSSNGFIEVTILSSSDTKLYSEEIRALAWQGYSLRSSKNSFILDTSDTGPVRFLKDETGTWFSMSALDTISPDKKLVAYIYWHDYQNKFITLRLIDAGNNPKNATSILHSIPTELEVSNMVDAVEWISPKKLTIKGDNRKIAFELNENGKWLINDTK